MKQHLGNIIFKYISANIHSENVLHTKAKDSEERKKKLLRARLLVNVFLVATLRSACEHQRRNRGSFVAKEIQSVFIINSKHIIQTKEKIAPRVKKFIFTCFEISLTSRFNCVKKLFN